MQISQYVRVRGARWRIADIRSFDDCQLVTLAGLAPPYAGVERHVLAPFDTIDLLDRAARPRLVRQTEWRRAGRCPLPAHPPPAAPQVGALARIDRLAHPLG